MGWARDLKISVITSMANRRLLIVEPMGSKAVKAILLLKATGLYKAATRRSWPRDLKIGVITSMANRRFLIVEPMGSKAVKAFLLLKANGLYTVRTTNFDTSWGGYFDP